jgi:Spy/CpxP family protein refolding chaperone
MVMEEPMSRIWIVLGAVLLIAAATVTLARVAHANYSGRHWGGPLRVVARELDLTDSQKQQIKVIWQTERPAVAALVRELADEQKDMNLADAADKFDENSIAPIANRQAATLTKLMIEKEKVISTIYTTVLTPEQRTRADRWRAKWPSKLEAIADRIANQGRVTTGFSPQ